MPEKINVRIEQEIFDYYNSSDIEAFRAEQGMARLEFERSKEIISRFLPEKKIVIYDVGGGRGHYSNWLAKKGHEVHLFDPVPKHLKKAMEMSARHPETPIKAAETGVASNIRREDDSADMVLFMGPWYHLTKRADRIAALREVRRVLKPGGLIMAVGIPRFSSTLYGLFNWQFDRPEYIQMCMDEMIDGQHRKPEELNVFTRAYFHHPLEFKLEILESGYEYESTIAIEGPGWIVQDLEEKWDDSAKREKLMKMIHTLEKEATIIGVSPHVMVVGRKPRL